MKRNLLLGAVLACCGCSTMSHTDKGLLGGGVLGATGGAIVGNALGHTGAGAAVGGILGAAAGGMTGNAIDRAEDRAVRRAAATQVVQAAGPAVPLEEIARMAQSHISDAVIINQIRQTGSFYQLTGDQIIWLRQQGVSEVVIAEMQTRQPGPVVAGPPPVVYTRPRPVYVIHEAPPPPVRVGIGFGYGRRCW